MKNSLFKKYFLSTHIPPPTIMFYGYNYVAIQFVTILPPSTLSQEVGFDQYQ
jgi:hypothetical protein